MLNLNLAILIAKSIQSISKFIPFIGGSALPGLIALKLYPELIKSLVDKNQLKSTIITGTNGKTTTTRLLSHILKTNHTQYIHNRSGSNLLRGIASALISHSSITGKLNHSLAIWEIDEAVAGKAIKQLKPQTILFTNLFRDQLDRYGEIDTILKTWKQGINKLPKSSKVILNLDDPALCYLSQSINPENLITFGLTVSMSQQTSLSSSADSIFCPQCGKNLIFSSIFSSHLGHYFCKACDFKRLNPKFNQLNWDKSNPDLPGIYSQYNILAAKTLAKTLKINELTIKKAIKTFKPAFGRAETFHFKSKLIKILLVKNPTGFNVTLEAIKSKNHLNSKPLLLVLNDKIADGTDVSWIWDVDLKLLKNRTEPIIISGSRAKDLKLRLKYQNIDLNLIKLQPNLKKAFKAFTALSGSPGYILPTYTSMLQLRKLLVKQKLLHSTWKD